MLNFKYLETMLNKNIYYIGCSLMIALVAFSCKKQGNKFDDARSANVIMVNASPNNPAIPIRFYVDKGRFSLSAIAYLRTSVDMTVSGAPIYLPVLSGSKLIEIRPDVDQNNVLASSNFNIEENKNYTFFAFDTLQNNQIKLLRLTDDVEPIVPSPMCKVRFVNLAPKSPVLDVTILRTGVTPADSVTFTNKPYVGNSVVDESALSMFTDARAGAYSIKLKVSGTQTVVATFGPANLLDGRTYTLYATGGAKGNALTVRSLRHS